MDNYAKKEENEAWYVVSGFNSRNEEIFLVECGYEPYEWRGFAYNRIVRFENLKDAQYYADHAPRNLTGVYIEKRNVHRITYTKIDKETIPYKPKGLPELIPF